MIGRKSAVALVGAAALVVVVQLLRFLAPDVPNAPRIVDPRELLASDRPFDSNPSSAAAASLTVLPWQRYPLGKLDGDWRRISMRRALEDEFGRRLPMRPLFGPRAPEIPDEIVVETEVPRMEPDPEALGPVPPPVRVVDFSRAPRLSATLVKDGEGLAVLDGRVRRVGDRIPDRDGSEFVLVAVAPGTVWIEKEGERRHFGVAERRGIPTRKTSGTEELPPLEEEDHDGGN